MWTGTRTWNGNVDWDWERGLCTGTGNGTGEWDCGLGDVSEEVAAY